MVPISRENRGTVVMFSAMPGTSGFGPAAGPGAELGLRMARRLAGRGLRVSFVCLDIAGRWGPPQQIGVALGALASGCRAVLVQLSGPVEGPGLGVLRWADRLVLSWRDRAGYRRAQALAQQLRFSTIVTRVAGLSLELADERLPPAMRPGGGARTTFGLAAHPFHARFSGGSLCEEELARWLLEGLENRYATACDDKRKARLAT